MHAVQKGGQPYSDVRSRIHGTRVLLMAADKKEEAKVVPLDESDIKILQSYVRPQSGHQALCLARVWAVNWAEHPEIVFVLEMAF